MHRQVQLREAHLLLMLGTQSFKGMGSILKALDREESRFHHLTFPNLVLPYAPPSFFLSSSAVL